MSGLEIVGMILGILGPIEQSIVSTKRLRDHFKSFRQNETAIQYLSTSLSHIKYDCRQLHSQLCLHKSAIPAQNIKMFETQLMKILSMFTDMSVLLQKMEQSAGRNFKHFLKASKWCDHCNAIEKQLQDTNIILLMINSFLGIEAVVSSNTERIPQMNNTMKLLESKVDQTLAAALPSDIFQPWQQKIPLSKAVVPAFDSIDRDGNPSSTEGKIKKELLNSEESHDKIFSIQGPGGVGKTTVLQMLSRDQQLREHFFQGLYHVKLGADAKIESTIGQLSEILRKSGGVSKSSDIESNQSINKAVKVTSEWLKEKRYLLLVDDVWEQKSQQQLGSSLITALKTVIAESNEAAMVFTTRDTNIAGLGEIFLLDRRQIQGLESRKILFQHARQDYHIRYEEGTEEAIAKLLDSCNGLPVAHSAVGKSVRQYSLTRKLRNDAAWRMYLRRQESILDRTADGYGCLSSIFRNALHVLDEDERCNFESHGDDVLQPNNVGYSYREMHRSLCILEKQQQAPVAMLQCMWNIQSEKEVRDVCENLVRVGLAEWHNEEVTSDQDIEGILIHDLLHNFAVEEAKKEDEIELWHRRVVEGYENRIKLMNQIEHRPQAWWKIGSIYAEKDEGYLMRNICRHLYHDMRKGNELVMLVTRPEWIKLQFEKNGLLQYESDVLFGCELIKRTKESGEMGMEEVKMIRDAARLSTSFIHKNSAEIWFQLYGRLMDLENTSEAIKKFLEYIEKNAPRPWVKPVNGLLTTVGSGGRSLIDVGSNISSMVILPGEVKMVCGCYNGEMVMIDLHECIVKKREKVHHKKINDMVMNRNGKYMLSVSSDSTVKIWDVGTWDLVSTLKCYTSKEDLVRISGDDKYVFTPCNNGNNIRIWDAESGKCVHTVKTNLYKFQTTVFLRDGVRILVAIGFGPSLDDDSLSFDNEILSSDGETISSDDKGTNIACVLQVWKTQVQRLLDQEREEETSNEDLQLKQKWKIDVPSGVACIQVNDDMTRMVIGHRNGLMQVQDLERINSIENVWTCRAGRIKCVAFSNDGNRIVTGSASRTIEVRNLNTGELICHPFAGHCGDITRVTFIEQGNSVVPCSEDGMVRVWKIDQCLSEAPPNEYNDVICLTCSPDESIFVSGHEDGRLCVWDAETGRLIRESSKMHIKSVGEIFVTSNSEFIISTGAASAVEVTDVATLQPVDLFKELCPAKWQLEVSRSGSLAVTKSFNKKIRIWDLKKCDGSYEIIEANGLVRQVFISDDDKQILISTYNEVFEQFIEVWNIENKQRLRTFPRPSVSGLSREQIFCLVEPTEEPRKTSKRIFCSSGTNEIRYGHEYEYTVLGTLELSVQVSAYSKLNQTLAVAFPDKLTFMKVL